MKRALIIGLAALLSSTSAYASDYFDDLTAYLDHDHTEAAFKKVYAENLDAALMLGFKPITDCFKDKCVISVTPETKDHEIRIMDALFHENGTEERGICLSYKNDMDVSYCALSDGRIVHQRYNEKTKTFHIEATVETEFQKEEK
jgi:hypothetical protein